jgi:hypothetical protein
MADVYGTVVEGTTVGANSRKILGDGVSGAGPFTRFGTPQLQAIKIVSATINFSTSYTASNSNFSKAVRALQDEAEIYYVGIPGNTATGFTALVHLNKTDSGDGFGASTNFNGSYENIEDTIGAAIGTAENDITITNVALTGLTFA